MLLLLNKYGNKLKMNVNDFHRNKLVELINNANYKANALEPSEMKDLYKEVLDLAETVLYLTDNACIAIRNNKPVVEKAIL